MNKKLYIFSHEKINDFKKAFTSKKIVSMGLIFNLAPTLDDIDYLDDDYLNNYMVDITSLAVNNGYYKLFIESYLYRLIERFKEVEFFIDDLNKDSLLEKYPWIFDEIDIHYTNVTDNYTEKDCNIDDIKIYPIPLSLYKESLIEEISEEFQIIPIVSLFSSEDNINYKINIDEIESILNSKDIDYIDITQIVHILAIRKDLILNFGLVLKQIFRVSESIKFLINENMKNEIEKYFPFSFKYDKILSVQNVEYDKNISKEDLSLENLAQKIIPEINSKLKGHENFKDDFKFNIKKFVLLNKLRKRKIFSIFLTGESGIGKTEFAKILSEVMYSDQPIIKINFGNYSNEGVLNSLIGSPLGYIGSEEGGELINKMNSSKSKVILIDEFEKATPSAFNFFYELLEDGKFTDRHGKDHNLDGYIIIFTSNMSKTMYIQNIPDSLKSRFDMVYRFVDLSDEDKMLFINRVAVELIDDIYKDKSVKIHIEDIMEKLNSLTVYDNLRVIKRMVEDIVVEKYYELI